MLTLVPTSLGELIDKITILEIKAERISDPGKRKNVFVELGALRELTPLANSADISPLRAKLKEVNEKLWVVEDSIRECERVKDFGEKFIELARAVYVTNDERAKLKKEINLLMGSALVEEKSYTDYS